MKTAEVVDRRVDLGTKHSRPNLILKEICMLKAK